MTGVSVVIIAKEPVAGRSKTRLSPPFTPEEAANLAAAALADTLAAVAACRLAARRVICLEGNAGEWLDPSFEVVPQLGGGFDRRLSGAITGPGGPTIVIGMDTPQITATHIDGAIEALSAPDCDSVFGPAADGGYWALGMSEPDAAALIGIPMSTPWTGAVQRRRLRALGLTCTELETLRDVDTVRDAEEVRAIAPGSRFAQTMDALRAVAEPAGA